MPGPRPTSHRRISGFRRKCSDDSGGSRRGGRAMIALAVLIDGPAVGLGLAT